MWCYLKAKCQKNDLYSDAYQEANLSVPFTGYFSVVIGHQDQKQLRRWGSFGLWFQRENPHGEDAWQ